MNPVYQPADLTFDTAAATHEAGLRAITGGQSEFDLAAVSVADSSAVATLIGWRRAALAHGSVLRLRNVPASVRSLAELYEVDDLLTGERHHSA